MTQVSSSHLASYIPPKVGDALGRSQSASKIGLEHSKPSGKSPSFTPLKAPSSGGLDEAILRPPSVRSSFSVDPARELKPIDENPKHAEIRKHYLDIAHYDGNLQLIDTFV